MCTTCHDCLTEADKTQIYNKIHETFVSAVLCRFYFFLVVDFIREPNICDIVPKHLLCTRCRESRRSTMFKECHHWIMCQKCSLCIDFCPNCNSKISDRCQDVQELPCYRCKLKLNEVLLWKCDHPILCHSCSECLDFCPLCDKKITDRLPLTDRNN